MADSNTFQSEIPSISGTGERTSQLGLTNRTIEDFATFVVGGDRLDREQAERLLFESRADIYQLMLRADQIRRHFIGDEIAVCSIVPGRLGGCSEDCKFCAQSARHNTELGKPKKTSQKDIIAAAVEAYQTGVRSFGIVHSGKALDEKELDRLEKIIPGIKKKCPDMTVCGGFGFIDYKQAARLRRAGLNRYNHNLETSRRFFPRIVTTHKYQRRVDTIRAALDAGLGVCAGGIFGVGEDERDRIDMAFELASLGVDTVPLNFLHPIEKTPLQNAEPISPMEILRITAMYRFILPEANIKVAGGRVRNLRDAQSWIFFAGASSIISGNYLTTAGREVEQDVRMIRDLGLIPKIEK